MPTIQEFSLRYARRIEKALQQDNFIKGSKVRRILFNNSDTYQEILKIRQEISNLRYEGSNNLISEKDQKAIIEGIIKALNFNKSFPIYDSIHESVSVECASNDHFSELGDTVSTILRGGND